MLMTRSWMTIRTGVALMGMTASLFAAACVSEVTVKDGNSGGAGTSGSSTTTGSAVTGSTSGSGAGGGSSFASCTGPGECEIVNRTCCGVCGIPTLDDVTGVNIGKRKAYVDAVCAGSQGCDLCAQAPNADLFAYCERLEDGGGQCVAADVTQTELASCKVDTDCRLRMGLACCEACSGQWGDLVAINIKNEQALLELVCSPSDLGCPKCAPQYPPNTFAACNKGRCMVDGFDAGG